MASHTEIKVNDSNWVVRIGGQDVQVKILEKVKKSTGRGWEFRCKRVGADGRVTGRNLVRGSGSFRRPGVAPRATGFSKNPAAAKPKAKPRKARPKKVAHPAPSSLGYVGPAPSSLGYVGPAPSSRGHMPPASAFFSETQEPGARRSSAASSLGSLRGKARPRATKPAAPKGTSPSQARREIERLLKHAGLTDLQATLVREILKSDGSEPRLRQVYANAMGNYRASLHGLRFH
jgi:hypothetical protein